MLFSTCGSCEPSHKLTMMDVTPPKTRDTGMPPDAAQTSNTLVSVEVTNACDR